MLTIRLIEKCSPNATIYQKTDADFLLEENDYGYYTTYHLHVPRRLATMERCCI